MFELNNNKEILKCKQHNNPIERICLNRQCEDRVLCLLCETHLHGKQFLSILDKPSQSYKRFSDIICEQVDQCIVQMTTSNDQIIKLKQKQMIQQYFDQLKTRIEIFINQQIQQIQLLLISDKQITLNILQTARLTKDFIHLDKNIFSLCMRVYEGQKISQILQNNDLLKSQKIYSKINSIHEGFKRKMQQCNFNMKIQVPQIRNIHNLINKQKKINIYKVNDYDITQLVFKKCSYKLLCQSQQFDSIISSSIKIQNDRIMTVSYDKKLRIHQRSNSLIPSFKMIKQLQYSNILTKINKIGQNLYAIGQSKQLLIQKIIQVSKQQWQSTNIMKLLGHQQRIQQIDSYNTRILGSCSNQGTKIWDLYKQRCQFTFKQQYNPSTFIFLPQTNNIVIGYNNHTCKLYSIQKLKNIRKYDFPGLPLVFSQEKLNQNCFYIGGFSSHLAILDTRINNLAFSYNFQDNAVSSLSEMPFRQNKILLGFRNGNIKIFDMVMRKVNLNIQAEKTFTHLSKPNGIVAVYEEGQKQIVSVGCNQRNIKLWEIQQDNHA